MAGQRPPTCHNVPITLNLERCTLHTDIVAMFCGPHENGGVTFRRIDAAIDAAKRLRAPLMIAGDANDGNDLEVFAARASDQYVTYIRSLYDPRANTLVDVELVINELMSPRYRTVQTIHLVTDWWHMPRAIVMLFWELRRRMPHRQFSIVTVNAECPAPPERELERERQGIVDYLAGTYGCRPVDEPYGKPTQERALALAAAN